MRNHLGLNNKLKSNALNKYGAYFTALRRSSGAQKDFEKGLHEAYDILLIH